MTELQMAVAAVEHRKQEIIEAFRGQVYLSPSLDVQLGHMWDSVQFKAGQDLDWKNIELFDNVGVNSGKTSLDSNITQSKKLDAPEAFCVQRIFFVFDQAAAEEDIAAMRDSIVWTFWIGQKSYQRTLLSFLPSARVCSNCLTLHGQEICPKCDTTKFTENLRAFFLDIPKLNWLVIAHQMSFWIQLQTLNGGKRLTKDLKMWCYFYGLHARCVC